MCYNCILSQLLPSICAQRRLYFQSQCQKVSMSILYHHQVKRNCEPSSSSVEILLLGHKILLILKYYPLSLHFWLVCCTFPPLYSNIYIYIHMYVHTYLFIFFHEFMLKLQRPTGSSKSLLKHACLERIARGGRPDLPF